MHKLPELQVIFVSLILITISILVLGPSQLLGFPPSAAAMFVGAAGDGFFSASIDVLTIPIFIKSIEQEEGQFLT